MSNLETLSKIELLQKCKQYKFVLFKLNKEIEDLKLEVEYYKKLLEKSKSK